MTPVELKRCGLKFKSQKSALEYIVEQLEEIISPMIERIKKGEKDLDVIVNDPDSFHFKLLRDMIAGHYYLKTITAGKEPIQFRVSFRRPTSNFRHSRTQFVTFVDDPKEKDWINFSYKDCIQSYDTNKLTIKSRTARRLVDGQRLKYLNTRKDSQICDLCERYGLNLEVDHIIDFKTILKDFCELNRIDDNEGLLKLTNEWIIFHEERAKYQLLCKKCHSYKSKDPDKKESIELVFDDIPRKKSKTETSAHERLLPVKSNH